MKIKCFLFCFVCLALAFSGCGRGHTDPVGRLEELLAPYPDLPTGRMYESRAWEWENAALPTIIMQNLYKNRDGESAFQLADEWALYLATGMTGGEAAVFVTDDRDMRTRIGEVCRDRLSLLYASFSKEDYVGFVQEERDTVLLVFLPRA